jgi:tRNA(Ile)-lysidine synthetase-like protein
MTAIGQTYIHIHIYIYIQGLVLFNVPPGSRLRLRARLDGDRFTPAWRERPVKLKDFLRGQKVPLHERDSVRVVVWEPATAAGALPEADSDSSGGSGGEVLAVYPSHVGSRCARDEGVHPPLRLCCLPIRDFLPILPS